MEKILDNQYYDLIINNTMAPEFDTGKNITMLNNYHSLLHVHKNNMDPCDLGRYSYSNFPSLFTLNSKVSMNSSSMSCIQRLPQRNLPGMGVIIGIIDTGIDYQHPAFQNPDGTTRILSIWDQTDQSGRPPGGFSFGSEYGKNHINNALKSTTPLSIVPTTDTHGHGTAIASIISGSPNEERSFSGIVPNSKLAVVKLKEAKQNLKDLFFVSENALCYQESDLILGIRYLMSVSKILNRPIVICIALGSSQGGHNGSGAISTYLDYLVQQPRTDVTVAVGNEGDRCRHYYYNSTQAPYNNDFYLRVGTGDKRFGMEIWPFPTETISVEISSPHWENVQSINPSSKNCEKFHLAFGQTTIWINNMLLEETTGDQLIFLRFDNPTPGIWHLRVKSIEYEPFSFHSWLPSGNLISNETHFFHSTPDTTITAPGNARNPLTVTAYNSFNGNILEESGRGFTRFSQINPDIAAPGYEIPCAIPGNEYGVITGTGAAAAYAAGAAAMVMEWGFTGGNVTDITGIHINRMIIRGAQRKSTLTYPNNVWGYGQLDVSKLFEMVSVIGRNPDIRI